MKRSPTTTSLSLASQVQFQRPRIFEIETFFNIAKYQCFVIVRGIMETLPAKPLYILTVNFTTWLVHLPKLVTESFT